MHDQPTAMPDRGEASAMNPVIGGGGWLEDEPGDGRRRSLILQFALQVSAAEPTAALYDDQLSRADLASAEAAEWVANAELAAQWLPATSPVGHRCRLQVSDAAVLEDMRRARWHVHQSGRRAEPEPEAV